MWDYERKLMYPVKIKNPNPELARYVISQYGGPYLNCLSFLSLSPKHAFQRLSVISAFHYLFENRPRNFVFFGIAYAVVT